MNIKSEHGMVTFVMRAGKDKVRSTMPIGEANRIINSGKEVVENTTEVIVDDTYFFPVEPEKKYRKNTNVEEMTEDE